jgi:hypothetical protein
MRLVRRLQLRAAQVETEGLEEGHEDAQEAQTQARQVQRGLRHQQRDGAGRLRQLRGTQQQRLLPRPGCVRRGRGGC